MRPRVFNALLDIAVATIDTRLRSGVDA
jgi:hypothetical protein